MKAGMVSGTVARDSYLNTFLMYDRQAEPVKENSGSVRGSGRHKNLGGPLPSHVLPSGVHTPSRNPQVNLFSSFLQDPPFLFIARNPSIFKRITNFGAGANWPQLPAFSPALWHWQHAINIPDWKFQETLWLRSLISKDLFHSRIYQHIFNNEIYWRKVY